jgi:hypothetical protein
MFFVLTTHDNKFIRVNAHHILWYQEEGSGTRIVMGPGATNVCVKEAPDEIDHVFYSVSRAQTGNDTSGAS